MGDSANLALTIKSHDTPENKRISADSLILRFVTLWKSAKRLINPHKRSNDTVVSTLRHICIEFS